MWLAEKDAIGRLLALAHAAGGGEGTRHRALRLHAPGRDTRAARHLPWLGRDARDVGAAQRAVAHRAERPRECLAEVAPEAHDCLPDPAGYVRWSRAEGVESSMPGP